MVKFWLQTLCVGCHDLGEFVRYYPRGRQVIDKISAKQTVMQLMSHDVSFYRIHIFSFFSSKFRTKRCVTTPLLPFKKWWSTTGRFWDAKYLSTKIIYFYAFFKNFSWFPCIVSLSVKMAALITHHISVNWTLFIFKSSLSCAIVASQYFVFNKFFKKKKMTVEQEMCSCLITASYDGIIRVWGRGLIRLFLFLIKVLK